MKVLIIIIFSILFASCNSQKGFNERSIQLNNKAADYFKIGNYTDALNLLNESIKLDSSYYIAYDSKIAVLSQLKKYDDAIETNKLLLKLKPNLAEGYISLGLFYDIKKDTLEANKSYRDAIRIFENRISKSKMIESNEINLPVTYKLLGRNEEANKLFEKLSKSKKDTELVNLFYKSDREKIIKMFIQKNDNVLIYACQ